MGGRISDDPIITQIHDNVKSIAANQEELSKQLLDPEKGYFRKVNDLEIWRQETIDPERKKFKSWFAKIIWMIIGALLLGGTVFGFKLSFEPSTKQQQEQKK